MISGTLAASVTPLTQDGRAIDERAFGALADFTAGTDLNGILALGTTGEGILFSVDERKRIAELFVEAAQERFEIAVNCGAQTTGATVELAAHAAELGANGIAVIAPPYFRLDAASLLTHFSAAAAACAPADFYVYELEAASGYPVPVDVILRLREITPNFIGMKVSDTPWERFSPYVLPGLDTFVGPEALIHQGMAAGAVGAVSALASAFPELVVEAVQGGGLETSRRAGDLRAIVDRFPRHAALKRVLRARGVPLRGDVRAPLRALTDAEATEFDGLVASFLAA